MIIRRAQWSGEAEAGLQVSAGADMALIRAEVQSGVSKLWRCEGEGAAWVVTRHEPEVNELVMVLGEGSGFHEFAPLFVEQARKHGLTVRAHVKRRGMVRMWQRYGVGLDEYVLRGK